MVTHFRKPRAAPSQTETLPGNVRHSPANEFAAGTCQPDLVDSQTRPTVQSLERQEFDAWGMEVENRLRAMLESSLQKLDGYFAELAKRMETEMADFAARRAKEVFGDFRWVATWLL